MLRRSMLLMSFALHVTRHTSQVLSVRSQEFCSAGLQDCLHPFSSVCADPNDRRSVTSSARAPRHSRVTAAAAAATHCCCCCCRGSSLGQTVMQLMLQQLCARSDGLHTPRT
jgi:hypothetical protein